MEREGTGREHAGRAHILWPQQLVGSLGLCAGADGGVQPCTGISRI